MAKKPRPLRVHAARKIEDKRLETECGLFGRTYVRRVSDDPITDEWRSALGNPFLIGPDQDVTCRMCRQWLKAAKR